MLPHLWHINGAVRARLRHDAAIKVVYCPTHGEIIAGGNRGFAFTARGWLKIVRGCYGSDLPIGHDAHNNPRLIFDVALKNAHDIGLGNAVIASNILLYIIRVIG